MNSLDVTLGKVPFPHMVFHLVLVYSNVEAIQICFSESYESLVEGFETCLWQIRAAPRRRHPANRPPGAPEAQARQECHGFRSRQPTSYAIVCCGWLTPGGTPAARMRCRRSLRRGRAFGVCGVWLWRRGCCGVVLVAACQCARALS